jgi:cell wall-associated NlpC family hydrolase
MISAKKISLVTMVLLGMIASGCGASKTLSSPAGSRSQAKEQNTDGTAGSGANTGKKKSTVEEAHPDIQDNYAPSMKFNTSFSIDRAVPIQFRYAILMDTEVEYLSNTALYSFIDNWWGTPYRIGGLTQRGVDCSAFVQNLDAAIFDIALPRTAKEQYNASHRIEIADAKEGDLVFFNTKGGISHVGVYLQNNKFVHASTSGGVMISDLSESYWLKRFVCAARPDTSLAIGH